MLAQVEAFMNQHAMTSPGDVVMVALSGGVDSSTLLHVLLRLRDKLAIEVCAAHLDHAIRPESREDAQFVRECCARQGVALVVERRDAAAYADAHKVSLEVGAREVRQAFLADAAGQLGATRIALAHHGGDQAETMLLRLTRGTGLTGLGAMRPVNGNKIRPFLSTPAQQVMRYAQRHEVAYRQDATNLDISIPRNRVRYQVIPQLERINPAAAQNIAAASELFREDEDCLRGLARQSFQLAQPRGDGYALPLEACRALHPAIFARLAAAILLRMGVDRDISRVHQAALQRLLGEGMTGKRLYLPTGACALREADALVFECGEAPHLTVPEARMVLPGSLEVEGRGLMQARLMDAVQEDYAGQVGRVIWQYADADALPRQATVRSRRPGDRMRPLGAPGSRKLKDILIDRKVSRFVRDGMVLLCDGQEVLWLPRAGLVAERIKITPQTRRVMRLCYHLSETEELSDEPFDA